MTYTPKVGDRVKWSNFVPSYTVTAVGERRALIVADGGMEFAPLISDLVPIPDTVNIEGASRDALLIKHVPWLLEQVHDLYEENSRLREALQKCNGQHYEHVVYDGPSF